MKNKLIELEKRFTTEGRLRGYLETEDNYYELWREIYSLEGALAIHQLYEDGGPGYEAYIYIVFYFDETTNSYNSYEFKVEHY